MKKATIVGNIKISTKLAVLSQINMMKSRVLNTVTHCPKVICLRKTVKNLLNARKKWQLNWRCMKMIS